MKKNIFLLVCLSIGLITGCKNRSKTQKSIMVKVEQNDSLSKAEVTITTDKNGKVSEEVQIFEGNNEEVMSKVNLITKKSGNIENIERKIIKKIQFSLNAKSGSKANGTIAFKEEDGVVLFEGTLTGLSKGTHAIHIHEKADCSSEDGKSSGGHWNPTFENHGAWGGESGYHRGDIGNFQADADGNGSITFSTDQWCLGCDDETKNIIGKAIIVHKGEDDLVSQPSGAAGARVSCAGIIE
jgi:Cu-Zn family superoxide dismutase|tara:strand:+ start:314 stop:1033 length:720 start_codon:yes stop_codon:yes gene_type:complete